MLSTYFEASYALRRFRKPKMARYVESFARFLAERGYARVTGRNCIRAAVDFVAWADSAAVPLARLDEAAIGRFAKARRRRSGHASRRPRKHELTQISLFVEHLRALGVVATRAIKPATPPALASAFGGWLYRQRGIQLSTRAQYEATIGRLIAKLGTNPTEYTAASIRRYILSWGQSHGIASTRFVISVVRSFLRYLVAVGRCRVGLDAAVPKVPCWRLASLPRYVGSKDVERIITAAKDGPQGVRDHAIVLLLARLGLRACEVARLRLDDISWESGTFTVLGKGRKHAELPLPQDVGNALARYIRVRPKHPDQRIFLRVRAPVGPLGCAVSISDVVRGALRRAGIDVPIRGAHLLRHSAATELLRAGTSLDGVRAFLRHSSPQTTAVYAKVDVNTLKAIARSWPTMEVA